MRLLSMYGTNKITSVGNVLRPSGTRPVPPLSAASRLATSAGARTFDLRFGGEGVPRLFFSRHRCPLPYQLAFPARGLLSTGVFSARVLAKIGLPPRLSYHVPRIGKQDKLWSGQKNWGLAAYGPAAAPICPVAQWPQYFSRPGGAGCCRLAVSYSDGFLHLLNSKRTNYMPNLTFPSPSLGSISPQSPAQPCGVLAVQPCLAPTPSPHPPSTPLAVSQPPKPATAPPAPMPSRRCAVKGCVFPVSIQGHNQCHYHDLLQSEAELFQSHQPSHLLSLQAPFGIPDEEPDDSRQQDRKKLAAERESFILDEAA